MLKTLTVVTAFLAGATLTEMGAREKIAQIKAKKNAEIQDTQLVWFHNGWSAHQEYVETLARQSSYTSHLN